MRVKNDSCVNRQHAALDQDICLAVVVPSVFWRKVIIYAVGMKHLLRLCHLLVGVTIICKARLVHRSRTLRTCTHTKDTHARECVLKVCTDSTQASQNHETVDACFQGIRALMQASERSHTIATTIALAGLSHAHCSPCWH